MPATAQFSYESWDRLLASIVDDNGKVDYDRLLEQRPLLQDFVSELGGASPTANPELFSSDEDGLAYWINAYNAFTLHAIAQEYPIRSVWKTRDGQFFVRHPMRSPGPRGFSQVPHTLTLRAALSSRMPVSASTSPRDGSMHTHVSSFTPRDARRRRKTV